MESTNTRLRSATLECGDESLLGRVFLRGEPSFVAFKEDWIERRTDYLSRWGILAGLLLNAVVLILLPMFDAKNVAVMAIGHASVFVFLLIWRSLRSRGFRWAPQCAATGFVMLSGVYALNLRLNVQNGVSLDYMISSSSALMTVTMMFTLLLPLKSRHAAIVVLIYIALGVFAFWGHAALQKWAMVHSVSLFSMLLFHALTLKRSEHEAFLEFKMRHLIVERNEIEREKDLELAREVQESQFPASDIVSENVRVLCYQAKYGTVCGDWMGVKTLRDGRTIAVVADATGHGVHAALVVQAVQTLWVDSVSEPAFSPSLWIDRVNRALLNLGMKKLQTITLGLVEIEGDLISYWSAGHVPLHVRIDSAASKRCRLLVARGNPLGLYQTPEIGSESLIMPADGSVEVMLGSDGLFANGTKYSERQINRGFEGIAVRGVSYVAEFSTDDDSSVIYLKVARKALGARVS